MPSPEGAEPAAAAMPGETAEPDPSKIAAWWRAWAEGGPVTFSGVGETPIGVVVRLDQPIELRAVPFAQWLRVQRLAADPFRDLALNFVPKPLVPGQTYEMRLLGRDKSTPTNEIATGQLRAVHFEPTAVHAIRRNIRLPGRPNTSVTIWWASGVYRGPASYTSPDDPLFFETLAPAIA